MRQRSLSDHPLNNIFSGTFRIFILLSLSLITLISQGCGTLSNGHKWGQDATLTPGWDRIKESAVNAAVSPETWGPVAGALALQIGHMDRRISDWASAENPVFGSQKNAANWSDYLEYGTGVVYFATVIITSSGDDTSDWLMAKGNGLLIGLAAGGLTEKITSAVKDLGKRQRPDESDNTSFPSGHASGSSALATLAKRNLDSVPISDGARFFADAGITALAIGSGWARVEAKKHYPADVLVGYSLGHFISAFVNDAFLGLNDAKAPRVSIEPAKKSIFIGMSWKY